EIATYLEPTEIAALSEVAKITYTTLPDSVWQPFLNRLHAIDKSIKSTPRQGQSIQEAFIEGFKKIKARQEEEIKFLRERHLELEVPSLGEKITLKTLEETSKKLDDLNDEILKPIIEETIADAQDNLNLEDIGITRLTSELIQNPLYRQFFQDVIGIDCSSNLLQTIPVELFTQCGNLNFFKCNHNKLLSLPTSIGDLQHLRLLHFAFNDLEELPESIGRCQALTELYGPYNNLKKLPESICNLHLTVYLDHNHIQSLPAEFHRTIAPIGADDFFTFLRKNDISSFSPQVVARLGQIRARAILDDQPTTALVAPDQPDAEWQPFLDQLHEMDRTIDTKPRNGQTIREAFLEGFEKIKAMQKAEIDYLEKKGNWHWPVTSRFRFPSKTYPDNVTLDDLKWFHKNLDERNVQIIEDEIWRHTQKPKRDTVFSLKDKGITRFPHATLDTRFSAFFKGIKAVDLQGNFLQSLPQIPSTHLRFLLQPSNALLELEGKEPKQRALPILRSHREPSKVPIEEPEDQEQKPQIKPETKI
ncbi:MAG: leucine-rich repeat domain-containing protein, partial [Candidatus Berkiellales bacterium]